MEGNSRWPDFAISNRKMQFLHLNIPTLQVQIGHIASIKNSGEEGHSDRQELYRTNLYGSLVIRFRQSTFTPVFSSHLKTEDLAAISSLYTDCSVRS